MNSKQVELSNLLATPATPGNKFLLLGQEEYQEHRTAVCTLKVRYKCTVIAQFLCSVPKTYALMVRSHLKLTKGPIP